VSDFLRSTPEYPGIRCRTRDTTTFYVNIIAVTLLVIAVILLVIAVTLLIIAVILLVIGMYSNSLF
jgi:hypothetical protein